MTKAQDSNPPEVIAAEMAKDRELRRTERQALTAIPAADLATAPQRTSMIPQSMGDAMSFASVMARSSFVPMHCRGNEGNCLAIVLQAGRWGMDPFAVANKAYFVKDGAPPAFEAQLVNAVVNSSGALAGRLRIDFEGEGEKLRCTVRGFLRADPGEEKVRSQSIARITTRNSPLWKSDPEQQLSYYTTRAWARMHCPEVLLGVYTPDEIEVESVRTVSAEMPRRGQIAHHQSTAEYLDDEVIDHDTGEVGQSQAVRGPSFEPEGRAEAEMGEAHTEQELPAWVAQAQQFRDQIQLAPDKPSLDVVETNFLKVRVSLPDDAAADLDVLIAKRRSALSEGAA